MSQQTPHWFERFEIAAISAAAAIALTSFASFGRCTPDDEGATIAEPTPALPEVVVAVETVEPAAAPLIQMAILLDVSGSMDGLISQARTQLWHAATTLAKLERNEVAPQVEIALYTYGNTDGEHEGYISLVVPFTSDIDQVADALFSLETSGSEEYCGQALQRALSELAWSDDPSAIRLAYIAGNESFEQGPIGLSAARELASSRNVAINTVFCGSESDPAIASWKAFAATTGGKSLVIDQNHAREVPSTPYDQQIVALGAAINETFVELDEESTRNKQRQSDIDQKAQASGSHIVRALAKASDGYQVKGDVVAQQLMAGSKSAPHAKQMRKSRLKSKLANLPPEQQKAMLDEIERLATKRGEIHREMRELQAKRDAYLQSQPVGGNNDLAQALEVSLQESAAANGYELRQ